MNSPIASPALPPLPSPFDYCYEWDGPYGRRKFSTAPHNGRGPDRGVALFTAEQMHDYTRAALAQLGTGSGAGAQSDSGADSGHFARAVQSEGSTGEAPGWRPIDTAPKTGDAILLGFAGSHSGEGYWMDDPERNYWREVGWFECTDDVLCDHPSKPTHWMPLPAAPATLSTAEAQET